MGFTVFQPGDMAFEPRSEADLRLVARLSDAMTYSRANVWRYPPGTRGRRHADHGQEELFVVLDGTLTIDLGDPPVRHEVGRGGVVVVESGTALQLRNSGTEELALFIYGAPPLTGQAEFFPDVD